MQKNSKASILIFTLIILSVITVLTVQLMRSVLINYIFTSNQIKMHQARTLAFGGVNLAISQLLDENKNQKEENIKDEKDKDKVRQLLQRVFVNLNKKQTFKLMQDIDGIEGEVGFCISCENGKLNINKIFDFEKNEFKEEYKKLLAGLKINGKLASGEILKKLTDFLKERNRKLDDISELTKIEGLNKVDLFYKPPKISDIKNKQNLSTDVYLQDLFTIWTDKEQLEFLFVSNSVLTILGLRRPLANDATVFEKQFKALIEIINKNYSQNLNDNWSYYSPIFGKENKLLNNFKSIFSKEFGPKVYSVISYGKVGDMEQKLLVVLKEVEKQKKSKDSSNQTVKKQDEVGKKETESSKTFQIVRMYWI